MILDLSGISKRYGKKEALHNVDIKFETGIYGLLGPNGAGKSTLMNIITGILRQNSGTVFYEGQNVERLGRNYRKILGYLPQNPGLYPFYTGRQLLSYFAKLKAVDDSENRINELLDIVNLTGDADRKVGGYSGGMKKRIGIAAALLNKPQLLVMDEPTAGLDPKERIQFRSILSKIKHESIIIISTHIVPDVEHIADNIILLDKGNVIVSDKCGKLLDSIKNKVWNVNVDNSEVLGYADKFKIVNAVNTDISHADLRIISDGQPVDNAKPVYPILEDVYMYYFGGGN